LDIVPQQLSVCRGSSLFSPHLNDFKFEAKSEE
jgi:hypothetical protein